MASESLPANLGKTMLAHDEQRDQAHKAGGSVEHDAGLPFQSFGHVQHRLGGETFRAPGHWLPKMGGRHFRMLLVRADHSRSVCACWPAEFFFFFFVEARTPVSRERYGHLVLLSSVSAWPFQQGASQRCADFRTLLRISRLIFLKHVFSQLLRPHLRRPKIRTPDRLRELANIEKLEVAEPIELQEARAQSLEIVTESGWMMREGRRKTRMRSGADWLRFR